MTFTCAECRTYSCRRPEHDKMPANCPMQTRKELLDQAKLAYEDPETAHFFRESALLEADAYGRFPRLKETIVFCQRMGYTHVGVAFCAALEQEAAVVTKLLRHAGIQVESVRCKCGGTDKTHFGIPQSHFVHPENDFEPACNPIGQAMLLNDAGVEFNIVIGLCVGHDSLFLKNANQLSTVLVVKDRVCGHNPVAAIYLHDHGYWGPMKEDVHEK